MTDAEMAEHIARVNALYHRERFVYVASNGSRVKVGCSEAPRRRVSWLRCRLKDPDISLIWHQRFARAWAVEKSAHCLLREFALGGEWFSCSPKDAVSAVIKAGGMVQ